MLGAFVHHQQATLYKPAAITNIAFKWLDFLKVSLKYRTMFETLEPAENLHSFSTEQDSLAVVGTNSQFCQP